MVFASRERQEYPLICTLLSSTVDLAIAKYLRKRRLGGQFSRIKKVHVIAISLSPDHNSCCPPRLLGLIRFITAFFRGANADDVAPFAASLHI